MRKACSVMVVKKPCVSHRSCEQGTTFTESVPSTCARQAPRESDRVCICIATANSVDSRSRQGARVINQFVDGYPNNTLGDVTTPSSFTNKRHSTLRCLETSAGPFLVLPACSKCQLQYSCNEGHVP